MPETVTPQEERLRREMVGDGLDPTDPEQRAAYEDSFHGAILALDESLEQLRRTLSTPLRQLLDWLTRHLPPENGK